MGRLADRQELLSFLQKNPQATADSLRKKEPRLHEALRFFYGYRINAAKNDAGLPVRVGLTVDWEQRRKTLFEFLNKDPLCTANAVRKFGLGTTLQLLYGSNLTEAKKDAGIPFSVIKSSRKKQRLLPKIEKLLSLIRQNPHAGTREIIESGLSNVCFTVFRTLDMARRSAGVIPAGWIHSSEAAKKNKVSRQYISFLIKRGRLSCLRVGKHTFVNSKDVRTLKSQLRKRKKRAWTRQIR